MANLLRLAILILLVWLAWRFVRRWLDRADRPGGIARKAKSAKPPVERMVRCRYCDLHLPEQEALHDGRDWYCTEAHRRADRENRQG